MSKSAKKKNAASEAILVWLIKGFVQKNRRAAARKAMAKYNYELSINSTETKARRAAFQVFYDQSDGRPSTKRYLRKIVNTACDVGTMKYKT